MKGFQLQLILYCGTPLGLLNTMDKMFHILIKPEKNVPDVNIFSIFTIPSINHLFKLDRQSNLQLPQPYSNCVVLDDNTLTVPIANRTMFDLTVQQGYVYTQQFCISVCLQILIIKICDCNSFDNFYVVSNKKFCLLTECEHLVRQNYTQIEAECKPQCPLECSKSIIEYEQQALTLDKNLLFSLESVRSFDFARDTPNGTDPYQFIYDNVVVIDIEYYSSEYTGISESPKMGWLDLISELSGHLHLFLGMSLLSFVEICELFAFMIIHVRSKPL